MPTFSERAALLKDIERLLTLMILYDDDETEDFEEFMDLHHSISSQRYMNDRAPKPKSVEFSNAIFDYPDNAFRVIARCDKASFYILLSKIENHAVFNNNSRNKQTPVAIQLLIVLNRLGCDGNGASINHTALLFGRSFGSIEKYTDRVFEAILSLEKQYVYWPDSTERRQISG